MLLMRRLARAGDVTPGELAAVGAAAAAVTTAGAVAPKIVPPALQVMALRRIVRLDMAMLDWAGRVWSCTGTPVVEFCACTSGHSQFMSVAVSACC